MRHWIKGLAVALALLAQPAMADRLDLTGVLLDGQGNPIAGQVLRIVSLTDTRARALEAARLPDAGRQVTTDAEGRFSLRSEVTLRSRRVELDVPGVRHASRLLELGFELDLLGQPALYWTEIDFTRDGPLVGLQAFVLRDGAFATPLTFHEAEFAWSLPDDPAGMRLSSIGADVEVNRASDGAGGLWRVDVTVTHQQFEMR